MKGSEQPESNPCISRPGTKRHPPQRDVRILFLQGPPSSFARELGAELASRGAFVRRINLCFGDWVYWHDRRSISYRGSLNDWEGFLEDFVRRHQITDIIYFADRFPYHRTAQRVARRLEINAIAFEYGYIRPDWIVVEPFGQSGYSHFPTDPVRIAALASELPHPEFKRRFEHSFFGESLGDVVHHLGNYFCWFFYPRFQRDRIYNPLLEYVSYPLRFWRAFRARGRVDRLCQRLYAARTPIFIVPLQMQNDYQIRANSPYTDQREFLNQVLCSFAEHAPEDSALIIKPHPLDNGLENWSRFVRNSTQHLGLDHRVHYLDGGNLDAMAAKASGMITINSTSGMTSLRLGCPVKAMGLAVYDIDGLTHSGSLDTFWNEPTAPDVQGLENFLKVMAARCHVRGDFYSKVGRKAAGRAMADRIMSESPFFDVFLDKAPRLERAHQLGIHIDV